MFQGTHLHPRACQALSDLLADARRQGVPAALVVMPEGSPFRAIYPEKALGEIEGLLTGLQDHYHVPLVNAREWIADENLSDSHHLTVAGAEMFTDRLAFEFLLPWLGEGAAAP